MFDDLQIAVGIMTAQDPGAFAAEMDIVVARGTTFGRDNIGVGIMVGDIVDGGIGMGADTVVFRTYHLADKQGHSR